MKQKYYLAGRITYCRNLFVPYVPDDDPRAKPAYSLTILTNKEWAEQNEKFQAFVKGIDAEWVSKFGKPATKKRPFKRYALRDGDEEGKDFMEGHWLLKASNKFQQPKVFAPDNEIITKDSVQADDLIWPGQLVMMQVTLYAFDNAGNKGVSSSLQAVKIIGGGTKVEGDYGDNEDQMVKGLSDNLPEDLPPAGEAGGTAARSAPKPADDEEIPW